MSLSPGETLGPYQIVAKIGAGGMGEVYRVRDTRLARDVAIKISSEQFNERSPTFSPDGRWLAYSSNESGTFEIYVRALPDTGAKWQVSSRGGSYPVWSRTANELFFETPDAHISTVAYSIKNDSFVYENPKQWSTKPLVSLVNSIRNFDLAPDGKRIVALMPSDNAEDSASQSHATFLLNFFDELERRVPVRK